MTDENERKRYRELCQQELDRFLEGVFLNTDPYTQSDESIILDTDIRSRAWLHRGQSYLSQSAQFCSLMKVDGVRTNIYHQDRYVEVLEFHPMNCKERWRAEIPFNHFQYPMMLDNGMGLPFDQKEARYACSLDDKHDKEDILASLNGLMLYSYHLGGITKFNQTRNIYRLANVTKETLTDVIRREMIRAQSAIIDYVRKHPEYCRPQHSIADISRENACLIMLETCRDKADSIKEKADLVKERISIYSIKPEKIV